MTQKVKNKIICILLCLISFPLWDTHPHIHTKYNIVYYTTQG